MNESHTAAKIRSIRSYSRQDGGAPTNPQPLAPNPQHLLPESVDSNPFRPSHRTIVTESALAIAYDTMRDSPSTSTSSGPSNGDRSTTRTRAPGYRPKSPK